ncbi:LOW QUALITY PROTEIN: hypothetical protein Bca4012_072235 [Brassica carinata]
MENRETRLALAPRTGDRSKELLRRNSDREPIPKRRNGTESAYTKQDTVNPKAAKTGEQRWSACRNDTNTDTATTTTQPLSLRRTRLRRTNPAGQLDRTREREPHHSTPSERDHKPQAEPLYRAGTPDLEGGVMKSRSRALTANKGKIEKGKNTT